MSKDPLQDELWAVVRRTDEVRSRLADVEGKMDLSEGDDVGFSVDLDVLTKERNALKAELNHLYAAWDRVYPALRDTYGIGGFEPYPPGHPDRRETELAAVESGSYDDGHGFGWKARGADPPPTDAPAPLLDREMDPDAPEIFLPGLDEGHHFGWRARIAGVPPTVRLLSGGALLLLLVLALALSFLVLGRGGTSAALPAAAPAAATTAPGARASGAASPGGAASAACAGLAAEDLTFTGLPGRSGTVHVTADCGVRIGGTRIGQTVTHCRVELGTTDAKGLRNPSLWDEGIGFDVGPDHYDVLFQASWYDLAPYVIAVPGPGLSPDPDKPVQPRGGSADIKVYGGPQRGAGAFTWAAQSGTITFNTEADPKRPSGGGTVDLQLRGGAAAAPIHLSGTQHAEPPCSGG